MISGTGKTHYRAMKKWTDNTQRERERGPGANIVSKR